MRLLILAACLFLTLMPTTVSPQASRLCFEVPGITGCVDGRFRQFWEQNGGLPVFGYPISGAALRHTSDGQYLAQSFQRNRLEHHPRQAAPYDVLLGRLGADRLREQGRDWRAAPKGRQTADCLWFPETEHSVCDQETGRGFRAYWSTHGLQDPALNSYQRSLALFGLPLTEPAMETNAAGDRVLTQWFERARFEWHPENPAEFRVLLGLLGTEVDDGSSPDPAPFDPDSFTLETQQIAGGLLQPLSVTHAGDGSGRLFVVEKGGRIQIYEGGRVLEEPFLDISAQVGASGSEQGLFAVAFHPDYRNNGRLFVHYTKRAGNTVIERYQTSANANRADGASATTILTIDQPFANHNGGQIAFGPDGYLYIGMGDGGSGGDPQGHGQSRSSLLGKILRIDVDGPRPYAIPPTNPFRQMAGARPEIWAMGLRNPWRFSFDRLTGDLFIGDVGQNRFEEIHWTPAPGAGGENYGWNIMEASACFRPSTGCDRRGLELPIAEYSHDLGCSVTGGYRYRGTRFPAFGSAYIFGDFCSGRIWALTSNKRGNWIRTELLDTTFNISSFGEDEHGELYLTDLRGAVYRLEARSRR